MNKGKDTRREIREQPSIWQTTLSNNEKRLKKLNLDFASFGQAIFFGAGSSYYLGLSASTVFQKLTGMDAKALPSSELIDFPEAHLAEGKEKRKLVVGISRSGETTETVRATRNLTESSYSMESLAVSCYPNSPLVEEANQSVVVEAAQEESVVMTQSFSSMLLTIYQIAVKLQGEEKDLSQLSELGEEAVSKSRRAVGEILKGDYDHFVFLGSGPNYGIACESMLKMKETALEATEAFHALEYRHGPKSVASNHSLVTFYLTNNGRNHERELIKEVNDLGAHSVVLGSNLSMETEEVARFSVNLDTDLDQYFQGVLFIPFAQQLGLQVALTKNLDPDEPRNLSQVVRL
ncbi:SIS domain-containing protein [Candidatus Bipolaricaulota bacterium]|nr:SIS domain-containing protein [Candidatus Bipolaricaulota bacterium]